jgi:hypothetical protein
MLPQANPIDNDCTLILSLSGFQQQLYLGLFVII